MKKKTVLSHRLFKVQLSEPAGTSEERVTVQRLQDNRPNDYEFIYAMQERFDEILDLKQGESMYFQPLRDNKDSKGIITRVD